MELTKKQFKEAMEQIYRDGANHGANYHGINKHDMGVSINKAFSKFIDTEK